uniref:Uncharacterized protein n=1 Tax=Cannabis sativa TaxID=3483 RepID=A0A803QAZ1_CANSA
MVIRDFNGIISSSKKVGGRNGALRVMESFREAIDNYRLLDFGSDKTTITWCNGHGRGGVMERLDRGLFNEERFMRFEGATIKILNWWEPDHWAQVVDLPIRSSDASVAKFNKKGASISKKLGARRLNVEISSRNIGLKKRDVGFVRALCQRISTCGKDLQKWNKEKKKRLNGEITTVNKSIGALTALQ